MSAKPIVDLTGWDRVRRRLNALSLKVARVGVLASGKGNNPVPDALITMVELAYIHEFGAGRIPSRSFIRDGLLANTKDLALIQAKLVGNVISGRMTEDQALGLLGVWGATTIQNYMTQGPHIPPKLADSTLAARRRFSSNNTTIPGDRPLVHTGQLVQSISWEVKAWA